MVIVLFSFKLGKELLFWTDKRLCQRTGDMWIWIIKRASEKWPWTDIPKWIRSNTQRDDMEPQADSSVCEDVPWTFSVVWVEIVSSMDGVQGASLRYDIIAVTKPLELHNWLIEWRRPASKEFWQPIWNSSVLRLAYRLFVLLHEHFSYILPFVSFVHFSTSLLYLLNVLHLRHYIEIVHDCFIHDHTTFTVQKAQLSMREVSTSLLVFDALFMLIHHAPLITPWFVSLCLLLLLFLLHNKGNNNNNNNSILYLYTVEGKYHVFRHPSSCLYLTCRPVSQSKQRFGDWILCPSSGKTYSVGSNR
jgi:hypothetical protein